eukprot:1107-Heterococcus_DN1.PRE.2
MTPLKRSDISAIAVPFRLMYVDFVSGNAHAYTLQWLLALCCSVMRRAFIQLSLSVAATLNMSLRDSNQCMHSRLIIRRIKRRSCAQAMPCRCFVQCFVPLTAMLVYVDYSLYASAAAVTVAVTVSLVTAAAVTVVIGRSVHWERR